MEAIRERVEAATPGPWFYNGYSGVFSTPLVQSDDKEVEWSSDVAWVPPAYGDTATARHAGDAEFIANAREDVPYLLAKVDALAVRLAAATTALGLVKVAMVEPGLLATDLDLEAVVTAALREATDAAGPGAIGTEGAG